MPTPTYTPLANITLGSSAASVTFSSISQAYRDLVLVSVALTAGDDYYGLYINNDTTAANYNRIRMYGNGSSKFSDSGTTPLIANTASTPSQLITHIMDYSATDKHKTYLSRGDQASGGSGNSASALAFRWANTSAITSIKLISQLSNFSAGSTFALYGVAA